MTKLILFMIFGVMFSITSKIEEPSTIAWIVHSITGLCFGYTGGMMLVEYAIKLIDEL